MQPLKQIAARANAGATTARVRDLDSRIAAGEPAPQKPNAAISEIVREAWTAGQTFDLAGITYSPAHWVKDHDRPLPYYYFLAGLVRSQNCRRIFEIGTSYGGSTQSMLQALTEATDAKLVTVDIADLNPGFQGTSRLTRIIGDANSEEVVKQAILAMGSAPVDLLYLDADHRFLPTLINFGVYAFLLRPRFVVIDDIVLDAEMRSFWSVVRLTQGAAAVNCVDIVPEIRAPNVGFGILKLR